MTALPDSKPPVAAAEGPRHRGVLLHFRRLLKNRRGAGAIEFAIVAPLLIMTYVGAFEISVAMTVARKVSRASSTVSDLLTQNTNVTVASLDTMPKVVENILAPFVSTNYTLKITGIAVASDGSAKVAWSRDAKGGTPYAKNTPATLPADLDASNTFIVRTEFVVPHGILLLMPGMKESRLNTVNLGKTSYFRQRVGSEISCSGCP